MGQTRRTGRWRTDQHRKCDAPVASQVTPAVSQTSHVLLWSSHEGMVPVHRRITSAGMWALSSLKPSLQQPQHAELWTAPESFTLVQRTTQHDPKKSFTVWVLCFPEVLSVLWFQILLISLNDRGHCLGACQSTDYLHLNNTSPPCWQHQKDGPLHWPGCLEGHSKSLIIKILGL